ncbi:hypothetical protein GOP47_0019295 [Adiantum capillus-veneris]|uniref:Uncharacterized protein n=1 Tax=Adiantum capillus-veneris TaxID=13818 RepID=A0A9D4UEJ9_ADICA|nr:hypothetical protein GOP47_0018657 [Adiantum capillus-veneris]KAI5066671.1 hypothetical protein GOP47_0019295 [Adiantum capillus-veneris]
MAKIHIVETSLVKPATPTKRHTLALNGLDLYWSEFGYARTVHFYRTQPGHHDFKAIVQSLRNSLSMLLVHFYPVAGRLVPHTSDDNVDSGDPPLIVLDCNDTGVEFIEACCLDVDFGQLQGKGFRVQDFFARLTRTESRLRPEDPIMSVQVTSFLGGGMAIGCSSDHTLFDGFSFACMMKSWAELCNGVPALSAPPHHLRHQLDSVSPRQLPRLRTRGRPAIAPHDDLEVRMVPVTANTVEKLKAEATDGGPFTSFECLAAHVWKARTRADTLTQQGEDARAALRFRVNVRARLVPKLAETSFGPGVIHALVGPVTAGELNKESLGATASRIHEAVLLYTNPTKIKQELERYDAGEMVYVWDNHAELQHPSVVVTEIVDLRTIGFYDADFGWGELKAIRPATMRGSGVFSLAPPPPPPRPPLIGGGSVEPHCKLELIVRLTSKEMGGFLPSLLSVPWPPNGM